MQSARAPRPLWPAAQALLRGLADVSDALRAPRAGADELDEARELLAYWERRARALPRWALRRRREARHMAVRWRARVRAAEQRRYGRGVVGVASQYAIERRVPSTLAHRGHQALRAVAYATVAAVCTLLVALAAVAAVVAESLISLL